MGSSYGSISPSFGMTGRARVSLKDTLEERTPESWDLGGIRIAAV